VARAQFALVRRLGRDSEQYLCLVDGRPRLANRTSNALDRIPTARHRGKYGQEPRFKLRLARGHPSDLAGEPPGDDEPVCVDANSRPAEPIRFLGSPD